MWTMAERALHAAAIVLVLALAAAALKRWQRRKAGRSRRLLVLDQGKVSIVYFHSPSCGVCRVSQKPILDKIAAHIGTDRLRVVTVDVTEKAEIAREWGVTTVPSIFVVDVAGEVAHVNNGLTSEPTLRRQVSASHVAGSLA
jgi:thiol-disulfide isomerase/thioredoxin